MDQASKIEKIEKEIREHEAEIRQRKEKIDQLKFERFLYMICEFGPKICKANEKLGQYRFIEQDREIKSYNIMLYPIYIERRCWYETWITKISGCELAEFCSLTNEADLEILIASLSASLSITWTQAAHLIQKYHLTVPLTHITDYESHNMEINFDAGIPLPSDKIENKIRIKYILVWPTSLSLV